MSDEQQTWDPNFRLMGFSPTDAFTVEQSFENIHILGQNGSGKTTGSGAAIAKAFLMAGYGGLICTAKPDEYARWAQYAAETGRAEHVIRIAPDEKWRFNFMAYEQRRPQRGAGLTENLVRLFTTVHDTAERGGNTGGEHHRYFTLANNQVMRNSIDAWVLARPDDKLTIPTMHEIMLSGPVSPDQVDSETWQETSLCNLLLNEALARREQMSPRQRLDLAVTGRYWMQEFPQLPWDTRGSILSTFSTMADTFMRGAIGELFSTDLNLVPEITQEGALVVLDLPLKLYGHVGLLAQTLFKFVWEQAMERRDVTKSPRPVFLWADEGHLFINQESVSFCTTSRSARVSNVYLSQSLPNYYWSLGGEQKGKPLTESFMGVMSTKIFHAGADPSTNAWASSYFAKSWKQRSSFGSSKGNRGTDGSTSGFQQSLDENVRPEEFLRLRKGGRANNFIVDAIIGQGGRVWKATGETFLNTSFEQVGL